MLNLLIKRALCLQKSLATYITDISPWSSTKHTSLHKSKLSVHSLYIFSLIVASTGYAHAKTDAIELPENATARSYGTGWSCNEGYRKKSNACTAVVIPKNAYSTNKTYGRGWECNRGFRRTDDTCIFINIPANGYLDHSGKQLKCNRGYLMNNGICDAINIPDNGFLETSSYGPGWKCERGYRADKNRCAELKLPENSHIDYSGNNWECDPPYLEKSDQCNL